MDAHAPLPSLGGNSNNGGIVASPKRPVTTACVNCHQKKVRCVGGTPQHPCSKCLYDHVPCEARTRKAYPPRKSATSSNARKRNDQGPTGNQDQLLSLPYQTVSSSTNSSPVPQLTPPQAVKSPPDDESIAERSKGNATTLFAGDQQGIGYLVEASMASDDAAIRHFFLSRASVKALQEEDLEYLNKKGVFSLPSKPLCDELIRQYFYCVHPMVPIIDAAPFLNAYVNEGIARVNLLLLWSIFSVSASFIDEHTLRLSDHDTRLDLKESFVRKAKYLFNSGGEEDTFVLIQSAILLSFWFKDMEDKMQSWFWTGMAITLSQTLGLHRNPDATQRNASISNHQRCLWRRIWWSCVYRDVWTSLGMGRPPRININDIDTPLPSTQDIIQDLNGLDTKACGKYYPVDNPIVNPYWLNQTRLAVTVLEILVTQYRPRNTALPQADLDRIDLAIKSCRIDDQDLVTEPQARFFVYILCLQQEAALIILYRKSFSASPTKSLTMEAAHAAEQIRQAGSRANDVIENLIASDMVRYMGPNVIALLVPPMQCHYLEAKTSTGLKQKMSYQKLQLCLHVYTEHEDNYPSARIVRTLISTLAQQGTVDLSQVRDYASANKSRRNTQSDVASGSEKAAILEESFLFSALDPKLDMFSWPENGV